MIEIEPDKENVVRQSERHRISQHTRFLRDLKDNASTLQFPKEDRLLELRRAANAREEEENQAKRKYDREAERMISRSISRQEKEQECFCCFIDEKNRRRANQASTIGDLARAIKSLTKEKEEAEHQFWQKNSNSQQQLVQVNERLDFQLKVGGKDVRDIAEDGKDVIEELADDVHGLELKYMERRWMRLDEEEKGKKAVGAEDNPKQETSKNSCEDESPIAAEFSQMDAISLRVIQNSWQPSAHPSPVTNLNPESEEERSALRGQLSLLLKHYTQRSRNCFDVGIEVGETMCKLAYLGVTTVIWLQRGIRPMVEEERELAHSTMNDLSVCQGQGSRMCDMDWCNAVWSSLAPRTRNIVSNDLKGALRNFSLVKVGKCGRAWQLPTVISKNT